MPQEFEQTQSAATPQRTDEAAAVSAKQTVTNDDALDAVLDDIESVLNENAEEYVGSFVQKGGE
ncbi:ubiquitin-like protein Pup [Bifidobacterium sp. UBA6881]|uniref:ubiquitin-like protein Pup n=1 Tax=Bifidobacterium sp. UBA6881 TaxID=1946109 RepID=UPI000EDB5F40|nr:ubiquitin-like protein Pup [Bifidobacterium sp. UBA6881]HAH53192.1 ubiquitin-like protein Pup [Bifidobacterium sp.]HAK72328.1 ubiquitin-like protein Pup [Bifidobacterium sp.]HCA74222.1 ubiquitin-like protein Pup [Bifidobacterium sp.]HCH22444.1 ubiquitin-like protein Pup [Bifidobacterium sp.]